MDPFRSHLNGLPEAEMSLSDRLRKARTQKLIEAGIVPHGHATPPEREVTAPDTVVEVVELAAPVPPEPGGLFTPITIEARPAGLHLVPQAVVDLTARDDSEERATCPTCHGTGFADMVDLVGHTVHYTCANCSTMWQVRKPVVYDSSLADPSIC